MVLEGVVPGGSIDSLCEAPFLLTTEAKSNILRVRTGRLGWQGLPGGGECCGFVGDTCVGWKGWWE